MADFAIPRNGAAYIFYGCLVSQADTKLFKSVPSLSAGDFKVSIDGGAFANLATLPTNTPGTYSMKFSLSAAEMTGDNILVVASDAAGAEWCDQCWNIQTAPRGVADLAYPATSGRSMVVDASGLVDSNVVKVGPTGSGTAQTAGDIMADTNDIQARLPAALVGGRMDSSVGAMAANTLTAAATAADFGAEIATAIWTDTTAGDFTVALSVGKSVMNGVALGTGLTINAYTGNTVQTGDSFARIGVAGAGLTNIDLPDQTMNITGNLSGSVGSVTGAVGSVTGAVGSVTGLTASNLDTTVSSRMATYTQPTGFLAATFPAGTVANTTNITAGTITTATNLTTNNDKTGYGLSAAAVQAIWDALTTALTTVGSIGKKLADWTIGTAQTGDSFARLGAPAGASVSADVAAVKVDTAAVKVQTDKLTFTVANKIDANILSVNSTTVSGNGSAGTPWGP